MITTAMKCSIVQDYIYKAFPGKSFLVLRKYLIKQKALDPGIHFTGTI